MKRRTRWALGAALLAVAVGLTIPAVVGAGPDSSATVQFGNQDVGSDFPFPPLHDASPNAKFNLVPRTVAISGGAGAAVTYQIGGDAAHPHQVAVYAAGKTPDEIVPVPPASCPPGPPCINDANGRLALSSVTASGTFTAVGIFTTPGRYLVICNIRPHFELFNMYGWVNVK